MTRFASAPLETTGTRPPQYTVLTERLVAEGWQYDMTILAGTPIHEWVLGDPHPIQGGVGWAPEERGRICWSEFPADEPVLESAVAVRDADSGCWAWLRHPRDPRFVK